MPRRALHDCAQMRTARTGLRLHRSALPALARKPSPHARPPPRAPPFVPRQYPPAAAFVVAKRAPSQPNACAQPDAERDLLVSPRPASAHPPVRPPVRRRRLRSLVPHLSPLVQRRDWDTRSTERREASTQKKAPQLPPPKPSQPGPSNRHLTTSVSQRGLGQLHWSAYLPNMEVTSNFGDCTPSLKVAFWKNTASRARAVELHGVVLCTRESGEGFILRDGGDSGGGSS